METVVSFWSGDPCDPIGQSRLETSLLSDSHHMESSAPTVSCAMWTELSPHLQRNKQLHDTLLQREEELARLQEENHKLRQFLNSSFVKDLEEKAKKFCTNGRRKRNLSSSGAPISKRVCRNLTAEFCSESEPSEPSLDLWVLKTLGLKDKDTIDTTTDHNVSAADHYHSAVDAGSTRCNVYDSPVTANMLQTAPNPGGHHDTGNSYRHFPTPQVYNSPRYRSQTTPGQTCFNGQTPNTPFTTTETSQMKEQQEVRNRSWPLQTTISYSPLKRLHFSCSTPKTPGPPCGPGTPTGRPDLAFSMCLSSNHSVKTHSFPHGQAFVRRDTQGRCNFTWVPRDRP